MKNATKPVNGHFTLTALADDETIEVHFNVRGSRVQVLRLVDFQTTANLSMTRTKAREYWAWLVACGFEQLKPKALRT